MDSRANKNHSDTTESSSLDDVREKDQSAAGGAAGGTPDQAVRRDIETLGDIELFRFYDAMTALKENATKNSDSDWWNICSIHGGGFNKERLQYRMLPILKDYMDKYSAMGAMNPWDKEKTEADWNNMGYCAHMIPTFLIWHRVYMCAFEVLLEKYDPFRDDEQKLVQYGRLTLPYWKWDTAESKKIPDCIGLAFYKGRPNPLFDGVSNEKYWHNNLEEKGNDSRTVRGLPLIVDYKGTVGRTYMSPYQGLSASDLDQAYQSFHCKDASYSQVSTTSYVNKTFSFEQPHNWIHNCVGGAFDLRLAGLPGPHNGVDPPQPYVEIDGDVADVPNASFDPIFWLHHCNIERMHTAWLETHHPIPKEIVYYRQTDDGVREVDMIDANLYPFPPKWQFSYEHMPWVHGPTTLTEFSKPGEWLDNKQLGYTYDDLTNIGVKDPNRPTPKQGEEEVRVVLRNVYVRGSGILYVKVKLGDHHIDLAPRAMFTAPARTPCPNCDSRRVALAWDVILPATHIKSASQFKSASQSNGHEVEVVEMSMRGHRLVAAEKIVVASWNHAVN